METATAELSGQREDAARDPTKGAWPQNGRSHGARVRPFDDVTRRYSSVMHRPRKHLSANRQNSPAGSGE